MAREPGARGLCPGGPRGVPGRGGGGRGGPLEAPEGALAVALPEPRRAGAVLVALARAVPLAGPLRHLKRLRRGPSGGLHALLCTRRPLTWGGWGPTEAEVGEGAVVERGTKAGGVPALPAAVAAVLQELGLECATVEEVLVPGRAPVSAEEAAEQSKALWPMAYKPAVRIGPALSALAERCLLAPRGAFDGEPAAAAGGTWVSEAQAARRWLERVAEKAGAASDAGGDANAAIVVSSRGFLLGEGVDATRGPGGNPLRHAVREALDSASAAVAAGAPAAGVAGTSSASDEVSGEGGKKRRLEDDSKGVRGGAKGCSTGTGYLLTGSDLYVLQEPCVMCAMALVHARVRRVFFCIPDPEHGMLGGHFPLQSLQGSHLNHYYEVFYWPLASGAVSQGRAPGAPDA